MNSLGQFDRLIRMVQETGERVVVSLNPAQEPVVLLPLSVYEQLAERGERRVSPQLVRKHVEAPVAQAPEPRPRAPQATVRQNEAVADAWDGEEGGEYDAERIFAQITLEKDRGMPLGTPDRLKTSISRASEALGGAAHPGDYAQDRVPNKPILRDQLYGEERFSLGVG